MSERAAMAREEMAALIEKAFADSAYPGDDEILIKYQGYPPPDWDIAQERFVGKRWREIQCDEVIYDSLTLYILSPKGAAYFCPKLILCSLYDDHCGNIFGWHKSVLLCTTPSFYEEADIAHDIEYRNEFRKCLTAPQVDAISQYVLYLAQQPPLEQYYDVDDAKKAYDNFWKLR